MKGVICKYCDLMEVKEYRSVNAAAEDTGISAATIKKYLGTDKEFKGVQFLSKKPKKLYSLGGRYFDLPELSPSAKEDFHVLRDFAILQTEADYKRVITIVLLDDNVRSSYVSQFARIASSADNRNFHLLDARLYRTGDLELKMKNSQFLYNGVKTSGGVRFGKEITSWFSTKKRDIDNT